MNPLHRSMPVRLLTRIAACLALLCTPVAATSLAYQSGHADIAIRYEPGQFASFLRLNAAVVNDQWVAYDEVDPASVRIVVPSAAMLVPTSDVPFLGTLAGEPVWLLSASQMPGAPFLGWSTEDLEPADWIGNVTYTLARATLASGQANVAMWQFDAFGQVSHIHASTAQPQLAGGLSLVPGIHDHFNLAFTRPGRWELQFHVTGHHRTDGIVATTLPPWHFDVIPEPSTATLLAASLAIPLLRRRRAPD